MPQYDQQAVLQGLAEMRAAEAAASASATPPAPEEAPAPEAQAADAPVTEAAPAQAEAPPSPAEESALDPDTSKKLARLQQQEARAKEALAAERKKLEAERAEFEAQRKQHDEALGRVKKLRERAKYDPAAALSELGLTPAEYALASKQLWLLSAEGSKDPKAAETASRLMREQEIADKVRLLEEENARFRQDLEKRFLEQEQRATTERAVAQYQAGVAKAAADTPIMKKLLESDPATTWREIGDEVVEYGKELGETPEPADVLARLEKRHRARLELMGVDVATIGKPAAPPAKKAPARGGIPTGAAPTPLPTETSLGREARIKEAVQGLARMRQEA